MELTLLIRAAHAGEPGAADRLFSAVYADLHRLAVGQLRSGGGIATTSLVHETYLRLAKPETLDLNDRQHFFAVAARAMRQIAIDKTRERLAQKRGGGAAVTTLGAADAVIASGGDDASLLALDRALDELESFDTRLARLVELRYFAGLSLDEAADTVGLSRTTVKRDWRRARAFLHGALGGADGGA